MKTVVLAVLFIFSVVVKAEPPVDPIFNKADELYDNGECAEAISVYRSLVNPKNSKETNDRILFRISYCLFFLGEFAKAEKGFSLYLTNQPEQQEARLKYAQSLYFNKKKDLARKSAEIVKADEFITDAQLLQVLIATEKGDFSDARNILKNIRIDPTHEAEILYWRGFVDYNLDQDVLAETEFEKAKKMAQKGSWIESESTKFLEIIRKNKSRLHGALSLGILNDTNVAQSGGLVVTDQPTGNQDPATGKNIVDDAAWVDMQLRYSIIQKRKTFLGIGLELSSPYYKKTSIYNFQNAGLDISYSYLPSKQQNYGLILKALDTFYNYISFQNYLILSPYGSWDITDHFWLKLSAPINKHVDNMNIVVTSLNLDTRYDLGGNYYFQLGGAYSKSSGPAAIISSSTSALISGIVFDRYSSVSGYMGGGVIFSKSTQINFNYTNFLTKYEEETDTSGNVLGSNNRSDIFSIYQTSLTRELRPDSLYLKLSLIYYNNNSSGFQGLTVNGYTPVNTFNRGLSQITATYFF